MGPDLFAFALAWRHHLRYGKLWFRYRAEPTQNPRYDHEKPLRVERMDLNGQVFGVVILNYLLEGFVVEAEVIL